MAGIEEQLRAVQRQGRRWQVALESIVETQNAVAASLRRLELESPPMRSLMAFAESFALAQLAVPASRDSEILRGKLDDLLAQFDLSLVAEPGIPFDPERHEACGAACEDGLPEDVVLEIVRPGFLQRNGVVRHAVVVVNRREAPGDLREPKEPFREKEEERPCSNPL